MKKEITEAIKVIREQINSINWIIEDTEDTELVKIYVESFDMLKQLHTMLKNEELYKITNYILKMKKYLNNKLEIEKEQLKGMAFYGMIENFEQVEEVLVQKEDIKSTGKQYMIICRNNGMWGGISCPLSVDGEVVLFNNKEEAEEKLNDIKKHESPINNFNSYFVEEV